MVWYGILEFNVILDTFNVKRSKVNLQGVGHIVAASHTACFIVWPEHLLEEPFELLLCYGLFVAVFR